LQCPSWRVAIDSFREAWRGKTYAVVGYIVSPAPPPATRFDWRITVLDYTGGTFNGSFEIHYYGPILPYPPD